VGELPTDAPESSTLVLYGYLAPGDKLLKPQAQSPASQNRVPSCTNADTLFPCRGAKVAFAENSGGNNEQRNGKSKTVAKGVNGNPGGRPKKKPITDELERLLAEEAPNTNGQTRATVIAEALLQQASRGNVRAHYSAPGVLLQL